MIDNHAQFKNNPPMTSLFNSSQPAFTLFSRALSERIAPLVIIIGSGLSRPAHLPDWKELRKKIELQLRNLASTEEQTNEKFNPYRYKDTFEEKDYWNFFSKASSILGEATFNGLIREYLDTNNSEIPSSYFSLLELKPKGLVTLNLDRLTGEAASQHYYPRTIVPINGFEINRRWQALNEERPFVVYLHGHISSPDTWVLNREQLSRLTDGSAHELFLSQLYLNFNVLFVGLSVDDIALSAPLLKLRKAEFETPRLFWLTSRNDYASTDWAKENSIQKIMYKAGNDAEHEQAIKLFCSKANSFQSKDDEKPVPIISNNRNIKSDEKILEPEIIAGLTPEKARVNISSILLDSLKGLAGDELYNEFERFVENYRYPIMTRCFYRDKTAGMNEFFGYKLYFPSLGNGNFGEVYAAEAPDGSTVAVKIMHNNIVANREMIGGFRRGVRSMDILTRNSTEGVVDLIESFEMPPTIVMQNVSGNSLEELFHETSKLKWEIKIEIINRIAEIVDSCHKLPEMVLHRDIKPSNIMIEGLDYTDGTFEKVFVLDFDMSWHKNSSEKDIVFESRDDFGYLAPEQTDPSQKVSARSSKVDSFGLGMTAYSLFGGRHPVPGNPLSERWRSEIRNAVRQRYNGKFLSAPHNLERAIFEATLYNQADRLDFDSFTKRISKIYKATSKGIFDLDVIGEEILCRVAEGTNYEWDDVNDSGFVKFVNGTELQVRVQDNNEFLEFSVIFEDRGTTQYQARKESIGKTKEYLENKCKEIGIHILRASINHGMMNFTMRSIGGTIDIDLYVRIINDAIKTLRRIE